MNHNNRPLLYRTWINIKTRCNNPKATGYANYGGRGIKLSKDWEDFSDFQRDMLPTYKDGLSLERIDNNQGYSKDNCRWATKSEQALNRRYNVFEFMGIKDTIANWARFFGFKTNTLDMRIYKYNWSTERALSEKNPYYA
jgi:hypothetical protein